MPSAQLSLIAAMLASAASAHVVLENPRPFKFVADGPTNPVSSTGDDFPCKVPAGASYIIDGERTVYAIGDPQIATFKGQAVHGGGSCQFALSADTAPTKSSTWMVIHSIEGGCPARNQKGNLEGPNKDEYSFIVPEGIAPGDYTFAWTWQARVGGQPEYYMNCAPITVVPAKKKRAAWVDRRMSLAKRVVFPELFMANMGDVSGGCTTSEALNAQIPIKYPNAGTSVDHPEGTANLFQQPCDGNPRAGAGGAAGGGAPGNGAEPSAASSATEPGVSTSRVEEAPASSSTASVPAESSASSAVTIEPPVTSSTSQPEQPPASTVAPEVPVTCPVPSIPTVEVTVTVTATITANIPVASDVPATPSSAPVACTEGYLTCLPDETHFATCTGGKLTGPQPIAPGFKCRAGEGQGLDISPL
ncbi:glycoside hydrolase [Colletotrichum truncatum]|uniref:Glycoside hydrolase n=1 Tax=Colletotrichum truncatum TaxID=5467 RepID=A0ACC3YR76_COLTU|nr:glycoside hydrolase [Colletotrichum truncatum]KAF6796770.1 glycoside hydrolase [Colletotrichum truncatum]